MRGGRVEGLSLRGDAPAQERAEHRPVREMIEIREPAGLFRRVTALFLDMLVGIGPVGILIGLSGVMLPIDNGGGELAMMLSLPLVPVALGYFYFGCGVLPNTVGRWLVGVRVRDEETDGRPSFKQAVLRSLTAGLWPLEVITLAFSDSKRRMGDRLAGTVVERYAPRTPARERAAWALVGPAALVALMILFEVATTARMEITRAAKAHATSELGGARRVVDAVADDDVGYVILDTRAAGRTCMALERTDGEWRVTGVAPAPTREQMGGVPSWTVGASVCEFRVGDRPRRPRRVTTVRPADRSAPATVLTE